MGGHYSVEGVLANNNRDLRKRESYSRTHSGSGNAGGNEFKINCVGTLDYPEN
jgi:hypothetical protein